MSTLKTLQEKRAAAHAKAVEFLKVPEQTNETRASYAAAMADVDAMLVDIKNIERSDAVEAELRASGIVPQTQPVGNTEKTVETRGKEYRQAWAKALQYGEIEAGSGDVCKYVGSNRAGASERRSILDRELKISRESRDISEGAGVGTLIPQIGTYAGLGYFVPVGFVHDVEQATKWFAPLLDGSVIRVMETASGQALPYPISNDTTQSATLVGENALVSEKDVTANQISFGAYKFTSGLVKASIELLQDSAFDIEKWLIERFAERWGRGLENYLTNGTGSNQPTGLLTAIANSGAVPTIAIGSSESTGGAQTGVNSIGNSDLINLEHAVDPSYRRNAKYMFHDATLASLKKVLDKYGRPLWAPGIGAGNPDTLNGYSYVINQSMPQIAASNVTVAFGDFTKFMCRKVKDLQVLRLDERFADAGQVGFVSFARLDSNLLDAGTHPINVLQQHS